MIAEAVKTSSSGINKFLPTAFYAFLYTQTMRSGGHFGDPELLIGAILAGAAAVVLREYNEVFPDEEFIHVIDFYHGGYLSLRTLPAKIAAMTWSITVLSALYYAHRYQPQVLVAPLLVFLVIVFHLLSRVSKRAAEGAK